LPAALRWQTISGLESRLEGLGPERVELIYNDIRNLAAGTATSRAPDDELRAAAASHARLEGLLPWALLVMASVVGLAGLGLARGRIGIEFRARNAVERAVRWILIASSTIANTGGTQPHTNLMPTLCIHFIIALVGIYPSRN